jgi:hypothetical protein
MQAAATYPPENSVEDSENDNGGNSIGRERICESVHGMPAPRCYSPDGCGQSDLCQEQITPNRSLIRLEKFLQLLRFSSAADD